MDANTGVLDPKLAREAFDGTAYHLPAGQDSNLRSNLGAAAAPGCVVGGSRLQGWSTEAGMQSGGTTVPWSRLVQWASMIQSKIRIGNRAFL